MTAIGLGALALAAWRDVATRLIPNPLPVVVLVAGLGLRLFAGDVLAGMAVGVGVFAVLMAIWWHGWLGGGDVKLLAAAAVLVPPDLVFDLVLLTALFGGVLAGVHLLLRARVRRRPGPADLAARTAIAGLVTINRVISVEAWRIRRGGPLPYGVAISAAAMCLVNGV